MYTSSILVKEEESMNTSKMVIATALKVFGVLEFIGGLILGLALMNSMYEGGGLMFLLCLVIGIFLGILLIAAGMVVELLSDIRDGIYGMNKKGIKTSNEPEAQKFSDLPKL